MWAGRQMIAAHLTHQPREENCMTTIADTQPLSIMIDGVPLKDQLAKAERRKKITAFPPTRLKRNAAGPPMDSI